MVVVSCSIVRNAIQNFENRLKFYFVFHSKRSTLLRFLSFKSNIKQEMAELDFSDTNSSDTTNFVFPNLLICSYQSHSRLKIRQNYPFVTGRLIRQMYGLDGRPNPYLDKLNMTQFFIDTAPNIKVKSSKHFSITNFQGFDLSNWWP